jgi:hypothetical protein
MERLKKLFGVKPRTNASNAAAAPKLTKGSSSVDAAFSQKETRS